MKRLSTLVALLGALLAAAPAGFAQNAQELVAPIVRPPKDPVFQARLTDFSAPDYNQAVEALISHYEAYTHRRLVPGRKGRVGLKIYTDSGPGMATPIPLVQAVIAALERRGYQHHSIFLVGLNQIRLRMTHYLPSLVNGSTPFPGTPVYVLESGRYYDPKWFYPSPLPDVFDPIVAAQQTKGYDDNTTTSEDRKSFLATPLFLDADFWINLPAYTDHQNLGVNGALVNATLWNASNTARFFRSPANGPAAVAEMSATPELLETWVFTIASLEHYQYIGGPFFNSLYTVSEPLVWLSADPVMLDALMRNRINLHRRLDGFQPISDDVRTLEYAEVLGVGSTATRKVKIIPVN